MMKHWIKWLGALLVAQLGLVLAVQLSGNDYTAFQPKERLLTFDPQAVDTLRITEGEGQPLELRREADHWVVMASDGFPADPGMIKSLLNKLAGLQKGWPVATSSAAAARFKVAEDGFERRITLLADGQTLARLYLGSSPGYRKVDVRPDGEDAVFAIEFNTWEASAKADDWIDKGRLKLDAQQIEQLQMPGFTLLQDGDKVELANLKAGEQTNSTAARSLLNKLANLTIGALLGQENKPEYGQEKPVLEIDLTRKGGDPLHYRFSQPEGADYYVLKRSDLNHYLKLAEFSMKPLLETTRAKLLQSTAAASEKPPAQPTE
jgi:hypothetical protein